MYFCFYIRWFSDVPECGYYLSDRFEFGMSEVCTVVILSRASSFEMVVSSNITRLSGFGTYTLLLFLMD